jgi:hypothetical protein
VPELDYVVLTVLAVLTLLALVLDRPLLKAVILARSRGWASAPSSRYSDIASDALTRATVRKVKVSKVGDYVILTVVLKTGLEPGAEVVIEEPMVILGDGEVIGSGRNVADAAPQ